VPAVREVPGEAVLDGVMAAPDLREYAATRVDLERLRR
jgi:hypothetical protein